MKKSKFRKNIEKFGMQTEFQNWMKQELSRPKTMKIGSRVRVKSSGGYTITPPGSEGVVVDVFPEGNNVIVNFYKMTGDTSLSDRTRWGIKKVNLELI